MPLLALLLLSCAPSDPAAPPDGLVLTLDVAVDAGLTDLARQAVLAVPSWLQDDLAVSLAALQETTQDELGALIVDLDEPWLVDEVAFPVAHMDPTVLEDEDFHPQLLLDNARFVQARDADLAYVELVEVGEQGVDADWYTTARYQVGTLEGGREERTIARDTYYWYLVHPRIEDELPYYVDGWAPCGSSECASTPEDGMLWREFLWQGAQEECPSHRECPVLSEYLGPQVDLLWEQRAYTREDNGAIGAIIQWQQAAMVFGAGDERPVQPNRIYAVGCGNCGEWADMATAAARTALIPGHNVGARANDHTWNEFWDDGWQQWEPVNTYVLHWTYYADANGDYYRTRDLVDNDCDGVTDDGDDASDSDLDGVSAAAGDCDDTDAGRSPLLAEVQGNGVDDDCDGVADAGTDEADADADGFAIADGDCDDTDAGVHPGVADPARSSNICFGITDSRPDTLIGTSRTPDYAKAATLRFTVQDGDGRPVDGALVSVIGNWSVYGYPSKPAWASEGHTGPDGVAEILVGEGNPYGFMVASAAGFDPEEGYFYGNQVQDAVAGQVYELSAIVDGELPPLPDWQGVAVEGAAEATVSVAMRLERGLTEVDGAYRGVARAEVLGVLADLAVVDEAGLQALLDGQEQVPVAGVQQAAAETSLSLDLPLDRSWYLVVRNSHHVATTVLGDLEVTVSPAGGATFETVQVTERLRVGPQAWTAFALRAE
ncbi:hypothetical protein L6R53_32610 [Myxococcota bacterium]|nr:hypothetical protein [Myxococcota bacterium]